MIQIEAISLSELDEMARSFFFKGISPVPPFIPGTSVSGVVKKCGSAVSNIRTTDRVVAMLGVDQCGGYAEYVV